MSYCLKNLEWIYNRSNILKCELFPCLEWNRQCKPIFTFSIFNFDSNTEAFEMLIFLLLCICNPSSQIPVIWLDFSNAQSHIAHHCNDPISTQFCELFPCSEWTWPPDNAMYLTWLSQWAKPHSEPPKEASWALSTLGSIEQLLKPQ